MKAQIIVTDPKINIKTHKTDCRCVTIETTTKLQDVIQMQFDNIDDAKAYYGLLGYALGVTK